MNDEKLINVPSANELADGDVLYVVQDPTGDVPLDRKVAVAPLRESMVRPVTEEPLGLIDGANLVFLLSGTPRQGSLNVFKNGLQQDISSLGDLTATGNVLTFNADAVPLPGDKLKAMYLK